MSSYDLAALKAKQDEFNSRKDKLLQSFAPFRNGLLEELEQFTEKAIENGLQGVKPCERSKDTNEILKVTFTLSGFDLVLVSTDEAYYLDPSSDALASKIFIYPEGDENNPPHVEITVWEYGKESYNYRVQWFSTSGRPEFIKKGGREPTVNKEEGHKVATALINHFYIIRSAWIEKPTLGAMLRGRESEKRTIGFLPPG